MMFRVTLASEIFHFQKYITIDLSWQDHYIIEYCNESEGYSFSILPTKTHTILRRKEQELPSAEKAHNGDHQILVWNVHKKVVNFLSVKTQIWFTQTMLTRFAKKNRFVLNNCLLHSNTRLLMKKCWNFNTHLFHSLIPCILTDSYMRIRLLDRHTLHCPNKDCWHTR